MRIVHPVRRFGRSFVAIGLDYAPDPEKAVAGVGTGARSFVFAGRSFADGALVTVSRPCTTQPS
jgi:hypothetical protein